ncbi:MAG: ATP-binding protein, partial [Gemmatimonadales bacterium]
YDANSGVGELVDNSIESGANNIWITYREVEKTFGNRKLKVVGELAVIDDGEGMSIEVQRRCLALGETHRPPKPGGRGIGRFGVGMTLGGISLARVIEVYTRTAASDQFTFTYLDLNRVSRGEQNEIPHPIVKEPPAEYARRLEGRSGTIVLLSDCDRLQHSAVNADKGISADEQLAGLPHWLGRTYRKFIGGGVKIFVVDKPVHLHDPLYVMSPTVFDLKEGGPDLKATLVGVETLELDVPGRAGEKATVTVTMTLLPMEWRRHEGAGKSSSARDRRVDENEGVSILRAGREVLYGPVPYIIGARGQARFLEIDRWWGCEIAFPPELDDHFHVRYIKRGAEPVPSLRDQIRTMIGPVVKTLRKQIQETYKKTKAERQREAGVFAPAEDTMASADKVLPRGRRGAQVTPDEEKKTLDGIAEKLVPTSGGDGADDLKRQDETRQRLETRPYSIVPVRYPSNVFFETHHLLGKVVIELNVNHPFYAHVFEPLCGSAEFLTDDTETEMAGDTPEKRRVRDAFMYLLMSYAKAESLFEEGEVDLAALRMHWGMSLGTVLTKAYEGR